MFRSDRSSVGAAEYDRLPLRIFAVLAPSLLLSSGCHLCLIVVCVLSSRRSRHSMSVVVVRVLSTPRCRVRLEGQAVSVAGGGRPAFAAAIGIETHNFTEPLRLGPLSPTDGTFHVAVGRGGGHSADDAGGTGRVPLRPFAAITVFRLRSVFREYRRALLLLVEDSKS